MESLSRRPYGQPLLFVLLLCGHQCWAANNTLRVFPCLLSECFLPQMLVDSEKGHESLVHFENVGPEILSVILADPSSTFAVLSVEKDPAGLVVSCLSIARLFNLRRFSQALQEVTSILHNVFPKMSPLVFLVLLALLQWISSMCYYTMLLARIVAWSIVSSPKVAWSILLSLSIVELVGSEVAGKDAARNVNSSFPNYDLYHRSDVFQNELRAVVERHPLIMTMDLLQAEGRKEDGKEAYSAEITVVTVEAGGKGLNDHENMRLLLEFGQHGRELVTSEVALRLLQTLGGEYPLGNIDSGALYRILPHATIKIVAMENLNGRRRVEAGDLCERKNGRGVDLNRNWGVDWGRKEKDYDPYEENPGISPFSEPESKMIKSLAKSFKPHVWVNVHSGMEALFMPYDHKTSIPADGELQMKNLLEILNKEHCDNRCVVGSGGASVGYLAHGTATDYMYAKLRVPMAFTWEIYGDPTQPQRSCFEMFNPINPSEFETVVSNWSSSFLTLLVMLPRSLHGLTSRVELEVWDWEFWPISADDIPDLELRKRFSVSSEIARRLGAGVLKPEEARVFLEFLLLLGGLLALVIFFKVCRCYLCVLNPYWYGLLYDRGRRTPV